MVLETAVGAQWDLVRNEFVNITFNHLGCPQYLLTIIGAWKIPVFIAILIPRFPLAKEWEYAGLFFVCTGVGASHLVVGNPAAAWLGSLVFTLLTIASYLLRPTSRKVHAIS
ncbi:MULTISPECIES: DoxX family protein [Chitinophagaceae]